MIEQRRLAPPGGPVAAVTVLSEPGTMDVAVARGAFGLQADEAVPRIRARRQTDRLGDLKGRLMTVFAFQWGMLAVQRPTGLPVVELSRVSVRVVRQLVIATEVFRVAVGAILMSGPTVQSPLPLRKPTDLGVAIHAARRHRPVSSGVTLAAVQQSVELLVGRG